MNLESTIGPTLEKEEILFTISYDIMIKYNHMTL